MGSTVGLVSSREAHVTDLGEPFGCVLLRRGRTCEIKLSGELDIATAPALDEAIDTALGDGPVETVLLDFDDVSFADSTTVAWLLRTDVRVRAGGGRLVALVAVGRVRDLLVLTGFDRYLTLVDGRHME
jgi:anti-sigma B factor antagonist